LKARNTRKRTEKTPKTFIKPQNTQNTRKNCRNTFLGQYIRRLRRWSQMEDR